MILRDGVMTFKSSTELVPGDIIILSTQKSFIIECDAILLNGSCIVDESFLTGESVPLCKVALTEDPNILYTPTTHKKNTLFCGTKVIQVQSSNHLHVKAIVIRTGVQIDLLIDSFKLFCC